MVTRRIAYLLSIVFLSSYFPPNVVFTQELVTRPSDRFVYQSVRGRQPSPKLAGRFEGETDFQMKAPARVQGMKHYGPHWSQDAHLLWDGMIGDVFETSIHVERAGEYDLHLQCTLAVDYGLFQFEMPDAKVREKIDLFSTRVELAPMKIFEGVQLVQGEQKMVFRLIGNNPNAKPYQKDRYLLGVDYLKLVPKNVPQPETENVNQTSEPIPRAQPLSHGELARVMQKHCFSCHQGDDPEGGLNLKGLVSNRQLLKNIEEVRKIRRALSAHTMPPQDEEEVPTPVRVGMIASMDHVIDRYLHEHRSSAPVVMRRMNRYEYNNAVRDLLKMRGDIYPLPEKTIRAGQNYFDPASGHFPKTIVVGNRTLGKNQVERQVLHGVSPFAIDLQAEGGFNNRGEQLSVSPTLMESFLKLGRSIVESPQFDGYCEISDSFFSAGDTPPAEHNAIARTRLSVFLNKAFRGNMDQSVLDRYHRYFVKTLKDSGSFQYSMKRVVAAVLASPRFLFLVESADPSEDRPLGGYQLATRLSFFLWSSIPDQELLALAASGELLDPEVLDQQVVRMLEDPKCQSLSQNFARQWLRLDQLVTAVPDFERFQAYYSRIGCEQWKFGLQTMIEPLLLFESIMVEDRSILLLIDSPYSYRSDELQSWYNDRVPFDGRENRNRFNTNQQAYRYRDLPDRREGGVLTSAATLTMTSSPLRTSPIARGAWVATVIFNSPPPPPPDAVPPIEDDDEAIEAKGLTLRERLVAHQVNQACKSCHAKIDPLGFALENYDAVGRWRDTYRSGREIDASGKLFGTTAFKDIVDLKNELLDNPQWFIRAFSEHMLAYAIGRELTLDDRPAVDEIANRAMGDHGQFTTIVRSIASSQPFRFRASQPEHNQAQKKDVAK